jgi:phenylacetate-CoA ligase
MVPPDPLAPQPDPEHDARTVAAIARALRETPYYAQSPKPRPIAEPGTPLADALRPIPLLFKQDLRTTLPKQWVPHGRDAKAELASGEIELVETSGSTGERTRVLWDKGWWLRQEERAFAVNPMVARALAGEGRAYRETILTTPVCGLGTCHTGELTFAERLDAHRLFLNMRPDPTFWQPADMDRMLDEIERHETVGLESDATYLAFLARHAAREGRTLGVRGFVVLTYAFTSAAHVRAIRRAYKGPLLSLYGASEVGVLFMEAEDGRLDHCPFTTHVELLPIKVPTPGAKDVALVVATTLDRVVQPLVRFVVGDVVQVDRAGPKRWTSVPPLVSVEGRLQDAVVRPDGAIITAGAIDRALAPIEGIALYQVNQRSKGLIEVDVVALPGASVVTDAHDRLAPLCDGLELTVRTAAGIPAEPSGKFRVVRRQYPVQLGKLFDGCDGVAA